VAEIIHERQRAAERMARLEMTEEWTEAIGEALGTIREQLRDETREAVGQLRAEFNVQRASEKAEVIDLPRMQWKRHSAA
jgi:hypothetical protein